MRIKQGKYTNSSGESIPAFGVIRVSGSSIGDDGAINITAAKPDGSDAAYYVNMHAAVSNGSIGAHFTDQDVFPVLYDDGGTTPVVGDTIGPEDDSFKAGLSGDAWRVIYGDPSSNGFVICRDNIYSEGIILVKTTAAHSQGSSQACDVYTGTQGSETDSGRNVTVYNRWEDLATGKFAYAAKVNGNYEFIAAACE